MIRLIADRRKYRAQRMMGPLRVTKHQSENIPERSHHPLRVAFSAISKAYEEGFGLSMVPRVPREKF